MLCLHVFGLGRFAMTATDMMSIKIDTCIGGCISVGSVCDLCDFASMRIALENSS